LTERQVESVDRMLPLNIFSRTAHHYTNIHTVRNIQAGSVTKEELDSAECTVMPTWSKRMRPLDEFDDKDDESNNIVQYLSPSERPADEQRRDPLQYWKNSIFTLLATLVRQ